MKTKIYLCKIIEECENNPDPTAVIAYGGDHCASMFITYYYNSFGETPGLFSVERAKKSDFSNKEWRYIESEMKAKMIGIGVYASKGRLFFAVPDIPDIELFFISEPDWANLGMREKKS